MLQVASQVATALPVLGTSISLRGGATIAAASVVADSAFHLSGGARNSVQEKFLGIEISPEGKSVLFMALAMACHYFGYSLARPATVALFTSASTGYSGFAAAFPFAMAFVSPSALVLLAAYGKILNRHGPRGALTRSTLLCASVIILSATGVAVSQKLNLMIGSIPLVKFISGPLFIFRESYVQLLTSQYWSFMASALTPNQSAKWFGPIAGLTSISSALAGFAVSSIVQRVGLPGALLGTGLTLILSLASASVAYNIANKYGFEPQDVTKRAKKHKAKNGEPDLHDVGLIQKSKTLFARVPVLGALFTEILASQGLATVLNVCFVACLSKAIPDDAKRAGFVGTFFAVINICTMLLQFGILPPLMNVIEPRDLWRAVPAISCIFTTFQAFQKDPPLAIVSASLMVMKVSEYSARRMLDEMIFVPLDFESRFVGKEIIGVFGYRFGKSLMSLGLSALASVAGNFGLQETSMLSSASSFLWLRAAWRLSNMVPTRAEAEAAHKKRRRQKK